MPKVRQQFDIHSNVIDKQAELQKKSSVYSTEKINAITKDLVNGNGKPDTTPFFHGSPDWRDAGVIFDYTDEELEILEKCANDCVFFVENYAKFLNKKGRTLVKLYDFQKENLEIMSAEKWDPDEEVVVPVNPDIVLMQSRQTSKCISGNTVIEISDYEINNKKYNIIYFIWNKIRMKLYTKHWFAKIVVKLLRLRDILNIVAKNVKKRQAKNDIENII